jgi:molybdenum cofactor cytidylyltransferase
MAIDAGDVALVLLAAGQAERFGAPKLNADLQGVPLGLHAARIFARFGFAQHLVVTGKGGPDFAALGYHVIVNTAPELGQASSLRLGVSAVHTKACVIALADMPFVTDDHIRNLLAGFGGDRIASSCAGKVMPPAVFGAAHFPALMALEGDQGARKLLQDAPVVDADARCLADIDTAEDLARWR